MTNSTEVFKQATLAHFKNIDDPTALKLEDAILKASSGQSVGKLKSIEQQRKVILANASPLVDGTLGEGGLYDKDMTIAKACNASKPSKQALFLYHAVRELAPNTIIELGTNVGISSAYLATATNANLKGDTVTLEASPYRARVAKWLHDKLELKNISYVQGLFTDTLDKVLEQYKPIDFSFIDGHHQYEPTKTYFDQIYQASAETSVHFFDDIRWSEGMIQAWDEITVDPRVKIAIDLGPFGIVICKKKELTSSPIVIRLNFRPEPSLKAKIKSVLKKLLG